MGSNATSIDAFIDALWLEEGLSRNTLAAYRRDLSLYAIWLGGQGRGIDSTAEPLRTEVTNKAIFFFTRMVDSSSFTVRHITCSRLIKTMPWQLDISGYRAI